MHTYTILNTIVLHLLYRAFCGVYIQKQKAMTTITNTKSPVSLSYGHVGSSSNLETGFVWRADFLCTVCDSPLNSYVVPVGRKAGTGLQRK